MSEFDLLDKAFLGLGGGGAAVLALFKLMSVVRKEQAGQAGDGAVASQFKSLQEQITQAQVDITALRTVVGEMDKTIHKQQRTITRMEMLLRQFSSLVQEHGIDVPAHMQKELDELIVSNEERAAAAAVDAEYMKRRKTDK